MSTVSQTVSPAMSEAYRLLRAELYAHLDDAEFHATKVEPWQESDVELARALIPDLVVVIRSVLTQHQESHVGRCRFCFRHWPCASVRAVHHHLTDPDREVARLRRETRERFPMGE
jgi:hypothetical protein